jgi:hypothetical protein
MVAEFFKMIIFQDKKTIILYNLKFELYYLIQDYRITIKRCVYIVYDD